MYQIKTEEENRDAGRNRARLEEKNRIIRIEFK